MDAHQPTADLPVRKAGSGAGPLSGLRVIEFAGIGPGPYCGMLLADLGASVLRIERPGQATEPTQVTRRNRHALALDLKTPSAIDRVLGLAEQAEALVEGFRPGVMERLGLGPAAVQARNPRLVYGRLTGWGQSGPLALSAGHDLNYIAITGALAAIGAPSRPSPPLNLLGDYAGGGLFMAFGLVAAILNARRTGEGQVVDMAMYEGVASLACTYYGLLGTDVWAERREANVLDGGAPFYGVYACADGKWISIAPLEDVFYSNFIKLMGLDEEWAVDRSDRGRWAEQRARLEAIFASRTQAEWCDLLTDAEVCFAPVATFAEAPRHPQSQARGAFVDVEGVIQPRPAPRFSRTPTADPRPPRVASDDVDAVVGAWLADGPQA